MNVEGETDFFSLFEAPVIEVLQHPVRAKDIWACLRISRGCPRDTRSASLVPLFDDECDLLISNIDFFCELDADSFDFCESQALAGANALRYIPPSLP